MPYISGRYYPLRRIIFFLGEGALIFAATSLINLFVYQQGLFGHDYHSVELFRSGVVTFVFLLSLYFFDLYDLNIYSSFTNTAPRITQAFGFGCIALAGIYYVVPFLIIPTKTFLMGYILICVFLALWRMLYIVLMQRFFFTPIIIIGSGELSRKICHEINTQIDSPYNVSAIVGPENSDIVAPGAVFVPALKDLAQVCREFKAEEIVVALDDRRGTMPVKELIDCKLSGVLIANGVGFFEDLTGKIMVEQVNPDWIIFSDGFSVGRFSSFMKRITDILLSLVGLVLASPIMVLSAIVIKLETPGPVFYLQERVGLHGVGFNVVKFRSMGQDAEKNGAVWAMKNDTRVTRFGSFIRKVRIDELPQLWNVLKGEMSFVGPRPERPVFVEELAKKIPYYSLRHNIMPGITGWAQICYPYGASEEDALRKLEYDLYYLKKVSISMDLWIVFQTIKTVLFQKGAR